MLNRCRAVAVADAEEGMSLHEEVRDRAGNVLLPKLAVLTGATIGALLRRGVETLLVVDGAHGEEQLAAERLRVKARIAHLFRLAGDGRANAALRDAVERYRMAELR